MPDKKLIFILTIFHHTKFYKHISLTEFKRTNGKNYRYAGSEVLEFV